MKKFLEVFPGLHMTEQMQELFNLVEVELISMSRDRSSIRIFILSPHLIHKQNIWALEQGIRDQLFPGKRITIKIFEKYFNMTIDDELPATLTRAEAAQMLWNLKSCRP